jgi:Cu(I)/Ag(I) efflux system membrane fusion protein
MTTNPAKPAPVVAPPTTTTPSIDEPATSSAGAGGAFWFTVKAIEIRLRFVAILVGIGLVIGYWDTIRNYWDKWTRPAAASVASGLAAGDEYYCPMHPNVTRDRLDPDGAIPKCPICGMPLSKRKKGGPAELSPGVVSRVQLSPYRVQLAGVETAEVTHRPLTQDVRAPGYVAVDETKLSRIVVRAAGYVEKLYINESFAEVREGEPLAEIYSPELYTAAQELLIAQHEQPKKYAEAARTRLELLGVAPQEIEQILKTGDANTRLVIRSSHSGHVFEKQVVEGDRVEPGQVLFELADLSTVWIEGELYEDEAAALHEDQEVEATADAYPGRVFKGRIALVHPHVETATRTLRVRCELANPNHELRPGMFATLKFSTPIQQLEPFKTELMAERSTAGWARELAAKYADQSPSSSAHAADAPPHDLSQDDLESLIASQQTCPVTGAKLGSMGTPVSLIHNGQIVVFCCQACPDKFKAQSDYYLARMRKVTDDGVLAVPEQAVIDTGSQKLVYVEREPGVFEGVAVTIGPRSGTYYSVIDGLKAGDRVAAAGAFLVDAETRLNPAASAEFFGASGGPSSDHSSSVTSSSATGEEAASGADQAAAAEANLAKLSDADRAAALKQATCPISGKQLGAMGVPIKIELAGQTVFLCCEGCKDKALADPQAALAKLQPGAPKP